MAKFIFLPGLSHTTNVFAGFYHKLLYGGEKTVTVRITARSFYRLYINGQFVCHGPARAGFGHARVDEVDITKRLHMGENHFAVEVAGYGDAYHYSNDITCEDGLLWAEVLAGEKVLLETDESFLGMVLPQRRTKADRYSHCRQISELYDLDENFDAWRIGAISGGVEVLERGPALLSRLVPYPTYQIRQGFSLLSVSSVKKDLNKTVPKLFYERETDVSERPSVECDGEAELPFAGGFSQQDGAVTITPESNSDGAALVFDAGAMAVGFIGLTVCADEGAVIDIVHAERIEPDGGILARPTSSNALRLHIAKGAGAIRFLSFEPYAMRYFKIVVRSGGPCTISSFYTMDYTFPENQTGSFLCSDEAVNKVFEAAKLTLRLCTLDLFMDCPDRERGGWLCDSFFTARAQKMMFGDTTAERAMLENFLHHPKEENFKGMFPACYPAMCPGNKDGGTINTWSMWLLLEVLEFAKRSGDFAMQDAYRERAQLFIDGLWNFKNAAGLLENLPGATFIDWSPANSPHYVSPISVAANALYARLCREAGEAYGNAGWQARAEDISKILAEHAAAGNFAEDALTLDENGVLQGKGLYSEAGQYQTLWSRVLPREAFGELYDRVAACFGPCKKREFAPVALAPCNMFIAGCVRLDLLDQMGAYDQLLEEILAVAGAMLRQGPGTLWESYAGESSRCHGFTSHLGYLLAKDTLGIFDVDEAAKTITVCPHPGHLQWARGACELGGGLLSVSWHCGPARFDATVSAPKGYQVCFDFSGVYNGKNTVTLNGKTVARPKADTACLL